MSGPSSRGWDRKAECEFDQPTGRTVPMEIRLNDNGAGRRRSDVSNHGDEFIFSSQPKRAYLM